MNRLYLECSMGAAGDMLMAALLELYPDRDGFLARMNRLGLPGVEVSCRQVRRCGIAGSHVRVTVNGREEESQDFPLGGGEDRGHPHKGPDHPHVGLREVQGLIESLDLPGQVKRDAAAVYQLIGEAEVQVHKTPMQDLHFHEVGTLDAVADVVGCCLLIHLLKPDAITASPVHVGCGFVRSAHGVLPIPAPATAYILRGTPVYGGQVRGELCTPTGAALVRHFAQAFTPMPVMRLEKIGYGMGTKEYGSLNCLRAFWGASGEEGSQVAELCCNLDDMTPEAVGFAMERLLEHGALDVFTTPIGMKKSRPGIMLTCLCAPEKQEEMAELMLRHTTTLGVRQRLCERVVLTSRLEPVDTEFGTVRVKVSRGHGLVKEKPEYEDLRAAALAGGLSLGEAEKLVWRALAEKRQAAQVTADSIEE